MKWYDIVYRDALDSVTPEPIKKVLEALWPYEYKNWNYPYRRNVLIVLDALYRHKPTPKALEQLAAAGAIAETAEETAAREEWETAEAERERENERSRRWHESVMAEKAAAWAREANEKKGRKK